MDTYLPGDVRRPCVPERDVDEELRLPHEEDDVSELFERNDIVGFYSDEVHEEQLNSCKGIGVEVIEESVGKYFRFFNNSERDLIYMSMICGKTQADVAAIFNKTQPAMCVDAIKIRDEITIARNVLESMDEVHDYLLEKDAVLTRNERNALIVFSYAFSITNTSRIMGLNPMLCRARIRQAIAKLNSSAPEKISVYFNSMLSNLNALRRRVPPTLKARKMSRQDYASGNMSRELDFS